MRKPSLRISDAAASALECSGAIAVPETRGERLLAAAWDGANRLRIPRDPERLDEMARAVCEASNAEAETERPDRWTRGAAVSLGALYGRLLDRIKRPHRE